MQSQNSTSVFTSSQPLKLSEGEVRFNVKAIKSKGNPIECSQKCAFAERSMNYCNSLIKCAHNSAADHGVYYVKTNIKNFNDENPSS